MIKLELPVYWQTRKNKITGIEMRMSMLKTKLSMNITT